MLSPKQRISITPRTSLQETADDLLLGFLFGQAEGHELVELLAGDLADGGLVDQLGVGTVGGDGRDGLDAGVAHDDAVALNVAEALGIAHHHRVEDLVGTVEVVVFPRDYERNAALIETDSKVFIMGRVAAEDDKASKLICEKIVSFDQVPRELWIQFADRKQYEQEVAELYDTLRQSDGSDHVVVYLRAEKQMKHLPASRSVEIEDNLLGILRKKYGAENVKVVEKSIEKQLHMH